MRFSPATFFAFILFEGVFASAGFAQGISVGSGASMSVGGGTISNGCGDLSIAGGGAFSVNSGSVVGNRNVNIAGGTLDGGSGLIRLSGDWTNSGTFNAGSGLVSIVDGCGTSASLLGGDSVFSRFSVGSGTGRQLTVASGSTQTFAQSLDLTGVSGNRLLVRSSSAGSPGNFVLSAGASQNIDWVDVADNDASGGETIAPNDPGSFNSVDSGGVLNWFISLFPPGSAQQIDTLPLPALVFLMLLLAVVARRRLSPRNPGFTA